MFNYTRISKVSFSLSFPVLYLTNYSINWQDPCSVSACSTKYFTDNVRPKVTIEELKSSHQFCNHYRANHIFPAHLLPVVEHQRMGREEEKPGK